MSVTLNPSTGLMAQGLEEKNNHAVHLSACLGDFQYSKNNQLSKNSKNNPLALAMWFCRS
jgi:hypothetical protein